MVNILYNTDRSSIHGHHHRQVVYRGYGIDSFLSVFLRVAELCSDIIYVIFHPSRIKGRFIRATIVLDQPVWWTKTIVAHRGRAVAFCAWAKVSVVMTRRIGGGYEKLSKPLPAMTDCRSDTGFDTIGGFERWLDGGFLVILIGWIKVLSIRKLWVGFCDLQSRTTRENECVMVWDKIRHARLSLGYNFTMSFVCFNWCVPRSESGSCVLCGFRQQAN